MTKDNSNYLSRFTSSPPFCPSALRESWSDRRGPISQPGGTEKDRFSSRATILLWEYDTLGWKYKKNKASQPFRNKDTVKAKISVLELLHVYFAHHHIFHRSVPVRIGQVQQGRYKITGGLGCGTISSACLSPDEGCLYCPAQPFQH
jgi:hypothetical protein